MCGGSTVSIDLGNAIVVSGSNVIGVGTSNKRATVVGCGKKDKSVLGVTVASKKRGCPRKLEGDLNLLEISVTIGIGSDDVDVNLIGNVERFFQERCLAGLCAVERGGCLFHVHFQMICRIASTSLIAVNHLIKAYLGWDTAAPLGAVVMCKSLKNKKMHTYQGMIGYCLKDLNEPHFRMVSHNVNLDEMQKGVEAYAQYGAGDLKNRVSLNPQNLYEREYMYFLFFLRKRITTNLLGCLLAMIRSGKYFPSASWVTPYQGRGMDLVATSMKDIRKIFFYVPEDPRSPCLDVLLANQASCSTAFESPCNLEVSEIEANEFRRAVFQQDEYISIPRSNRGIHIS